MKILTYRELKVKDGLLPLMDQAFRWPFNPRRFEKFIRIDPRSKDSPVGFCAVENDKVVGYVGVLDLATRTLDGDVKYVGGIYGVATLPGYTQRGISTALMNKSHEYFKSKGYHFSFLNTSPTLIAYAFYRKLGYSDVLEYSSVYKVLKKRGKAKSSLEVISGKLDFDKILKIFREFSKGKTGFVVRDVAYMKMIKKAESLTARQFIVSDYGYVIFRKEKTGVWIRELVALNSKEAERLISYVEEMAKDLVYDRAVLDEQLLRVYASRGYTVQRRSHGVLMVKPLTTSVSFTETYGDNFYLSGLDTF